MVLCILPHEAKAVLGLFCLSLNMFGSSGRITIQYDTQMDNG